MNVPVQPVCLEGLARWQSTLVVPVRRLAPVVGAAASTTSITHQPTRPFHHQARSRRVSPPVSRSTPRIPPLPITPRRLLHHKSSCSTLPIPHNPEPTIHPVFERATCTYQYVVADPATATAVIIDPVLDYDPCTRTVATATADALLALVAAHGYRVSHILETHAHADHLTAAFYLQRRLAERQGQGQGGRPKVGIGKRIQRVQRYFGGRYGVGEGEYQGVFDVLWEDDAVFEVGSLRGRVLHLPGHTEDHVGYWIGGESSLPTVPTTRGQR